MSEQTSEATEDITEESGDEPNEEIQSPFNHGVMERMARAKIGRLSSGRLFDFQFGIMFHLKGGVFPDSGWTIAVWEKDVGCFASVPATRLNEVRYIRQLHPVTFTVDDLVRTVHAIDQSFDKLWEEKKQEEKSQWEKNSRLLEEARVKRESKQQQAEQS